MASSRATEAALTRKVRPMAKRITATMIDRFVADVVERYQPERIILFGSRATGHATSDSDVDMLVIMACEPPYPRVSADIVCSCDPPFPIDLIVRPPAVLKERLKTGDAFFQEIVSRGRVMYEVRR